MESRKIDLYALLKIDKNASESDVKKAYKKLAKEYHPDKQDGLNQDNIEKNTKLFTQISNAYRILIDKNKRNAYDNGGILSEKDFPNYYSTDTQAPTSPAHTKPSPAPSTQQKPTQTAEELLLELEKAIQTQNSILIEKTCAELIDRKIPVSEQILINAIRQITRRTKEIFGIMDTVITTGNIISEKILLVGLLHPYANDLLDKILNAIKQTNGKLTSGTLNVAIENGNKNYILGICQLLVDKKIPIPEASIIAIIKKLKGTTLEGKLVAATAIPFAIQSGSTITEETLLAAMDSAWKHDLLPVVINAIKDSKGNITPFILNESINRGESQYILGICQLLVDKKIPIPEASIIAIIKKLKGTTLEGKLVAATAIPFAIQSGSTITEETLLAAMDSAWKHELLPVVINAMKDAKGNITPFILNESINRGESQYILGICQLLVDKKIPIPEASIIAVIKKLKGTTLEGKLVAATAIPFAIQSGSTITEKTLLAAMESAWKLDLLPVVLNAMTRSNSSLTLKSLESILPHINANNYQQAFSLYKGAKNEKFVELTNKYKFNQPPVNEPTSMFNKRF